MRITVIDVEHDDAAAAIAAIHAALGARSNGTTAHSPIVASERVTPALEAKKKKAPEVIEEEPAVRVSKPALQTWEWLVKHDRSWGISVREIADAMGIKEAATAWRLKRLVDAGLAYPVKRGYYRAGEKR